MQTTKDKAYEKVARLVKQFHEHIDEYKRGNYNEHQTRVDYINPFFKTLGWDMDNRQGLAEAYREVIHEDKIKIGGSTKAPDYCFTVYGQRKFFVDAKKPSVNIKGDIAPAYQVRRYGWSARLPISIVTDFEEFSIYDCNKKPNQTDKASVSRIKYITYDNYLDEFDFFWDTFAKENILKGRFDKYVQSDAKKRGTANVDDEFLKSIEEWRTYLATTIALRNKSLSEDEINYAVQKNIDRMLFLRICEDRGIEHYGDLKNAIKKGDLYQNLFKLYRIADEKYNSGLFDFNEDTITPSLTVDNKVVKNIINDLYYPVSPYEFSVLPADILGSVYERFLGKTIRLTKAHYAKIEEKPEVRKAGGVYYTPKYIVDYIVENTVGKLIKDKKPKDIEKIKIVDPACGSGSFLIGAYQYLLDRHLQYYTENPPQKKKDNPLTPDGNLTTAEKKRILLNNIYGVDIDAQAVEVTKLNLLLKALEGETNASISKQLTFFNERVLPNLGDNIKCGNSLIGNDFYDNQLVLFPEQIKKINAFDWDKAFPEIFKNGGFDVVIGNPPYIRIQTLTDTSSETIEYYNENFRSAKVGNYDIYVLFVEKGLELLNKQGEIGFILPHKFFNSQYGEGIREILSNGRHLSKIIHFGSQQVFSQASTYTCLLFATSKPIEAVNVVKVADISNWLSGHDENGETGYVNHKHLSKESWNLILGEKGLLIEKLSQIENTLGRYCRIFQGLVTGADKIFIVEADMDIEDSITKTYLKSDCISPYSFPKTNLKIIFPYQIINDKAHLIPKNQFKSKYQKTWKHLKQNESILRAREKGKWNHDGWYAYSRSQNLTQMEGEKLIIQVLSLQPRWIYDNKGLYMTGGGGGPFYGVRLFDKNEPIKYLMGILNSKLFGFIVKSQSTEMRGGYIRYSKQYIDTVPIPLYQNNKTIGNQLLKHVDNLLNLNKELQSTKLDTQRQQLQRAIAHAETKIDELVYELYGLSEEEIGIVENG